MPIAECGRMVPAQLTHSAVDELDGTGVLPGPLVTDQLGLCEAS